MGKEQELIRRMSKNLGKTNETPLIDAVSVAPVTPVTPTKVTAKKTDKKTDKKYEMVNHPQHYNNYDVEVVDMMEKIWGTKATMEWCKMTAYKYRMRMGTKPADEDTKEAMKNKLMEDFEKEQWYLDKAKELGSKLQEC